MNFIRSLLLWTNIEITKPASYGPLHLSFFFTGLVVSFLVAFLLRNSKEKGFRITMFVSGSFLILTEVYKQLYYFFILRCGDLYAWYIFPFQLCSVPMYLSIAVAFMKPGKLRDALCDFMLSFNLMGGFISFLEPSGILNAKLPLTIHSLCWHMMLVFIGLFLGLSGHAGKQLKNYKYTVVVFAILSAIAFSLNLIFWGPANGDINMFFIGPQITSIAVFHDIALRYGWYVCTPLYMLCMCIAAFLFYLPFALLNESKEKKRKTIITGNILKGTI